jgi:cysteine synthase A
MIYNSITEAIGHTPLIKIKSASTKDATVYGKLEGLNPSGSIKDRAAMSMINAALLDGKITKNSVIIEPTSGNTGIGLAMVCASLGIKLVLTMPENMSVERIKILKAYGAEIVLTERTKGMAGAIAKAEELKTKLGNAFIPAQFDNPANANAHVTGTASEIFSDLPDTKWIVAGVGSGGTVMGIKKYIDIFKLAAKICAVEPAGSALLTGGKAGVHKIQGIGANFVPKLVDRSSLDAVEDIPDEAAIACAKSLAKDEGIFVGISGGAAIAGAKSLIAKGAKGNIVVILSDSGMKYLSTELCND